MKVKIAGLCFVSSLIYGVVKEECDFCSQCPVRGGSGEKKGERGRGTEKGEGRGGDYHYYYS